LQGLTFSAAAALVMWLAGGALGFESIGVAEVDQYMDTRSHQTSVGGSQMQENNRYLGPVNVLFRPFPWEVRGPTAVLASLEILALWLVVWQNRRGAFELVRSSRRNRLFCLAIVFTVVYSSALGMSLGNLGIVVRQRVHLFPFLLMFAGYPATPRSSSRSRLGAAETVGRGVSVSESARK
jgi:hypothetical protein